MDSKNRVESVGDSWTAGILLFGIPLVFGTTTVREVVEAMLPFLIGVKAALTDEEFTQFLDEFEEAYIIAEWGKLT